MTAIVDQIIAEHRRWHLRDANKNSARGANCDCGKALDDGPYSLFTVGACDDAHLRHVAEVTEQAVREQATVPLRVELARYEKLLDWALDDRSRGEITGGRNATVWAIKIVRGKS